MYNYYMVYMNDILPFYFPFGAYTTAVFSFLSLGKKTECEDRFEIVSPNSFQANMGATWVLRLREPFMGTLSPESASFPSYVR